MTPLPERLPDWPERLAALLTERLARPFTWGEHDCALFAADAVQAITGTDPAADLRGRWCTEGGANDVLAELGGMAAAATALLGEPLPAPLLAQRGDVVLLEATGGPTLAVVADGGRCAVPGPDGLVRAPLALATHAWRV